MRIALLLTMSALFSCVALAQPGPARELNLMPMPSQFQLGTGDMNINQSFTVALTGYKEPRLERAADRFLTNLSGRTGLHFSPVVESDKASFIIHTERASK